MRRTRLGFPTWAAVLTLSGFVAACATVSGGEAAGVYYSSQAEVEADLERRSNMLLQNALGDDELRSLLFEAYAAAPRSPDLYISHAWGETFDGSGIYFKEEGRTRREGTFEIAEGMVCVEGPAIDRRCRYVIPYAEGLYTFVDSSDGSQEILAVTAR